MSRRAAWGRTTLTVALVVALDQVTKKLARDGIRPGEEDAIFPALKLVNVRNEGVAFGIDAGGKTLVIALIALALLALVLYFARHTAKPLIWLPTGLLVGGALGNIVDRIRDGAVTDFLKIPAWPAFNVADVAITLGVLALVLVLERKPDESQG
ncbi:MAG: signal peptidase II [Actinomycetota bacterium]|nr:signal peptidase II [Actinomycetota bacterium]MDQ5808237.1 signal peptidase II [Actinomycetota bacterium]